MEEEKNIENHETKKCHGFNCHCGAKGHKIIKLVIVLIIASILVNIGVAIGRHEGNREGNFGRHGRRSFGCGMMNANWQQNGQVGNQVQGGQFRMMRSNQGFNNQEFQNFDNGQAAGGRIQVITTEGAQPNAPQIAPAKTASTTPVK
jgi:hypothetical protein